jgi:xylulokinase
MMKKYPCLLGIDIGTTAIKVAASEINGRILALSRMSTPANRIADGMAEQNAEDLWLSVSSLIRSVTDHLPSIFQVEAVATASVGEAGVPIDEQGKPLFPIIAWYDKRTHEEADWWRREVGEERLYKITGMPIDTFFGANKILWIRKHYPEIINKTHCWLSVADFIVRRLCNENVTDYSLASRTMLFDQLKMTWSQELLDIADLDKDIMPEPYASGTRVGEITKEAAKITGLRQGLPVVLGGHDHLCGAYFARLGKDMAVNSTGTAEVVVFPVEEYIPRTPTEAGFIPIYADVVPGRYILSARVGYAGQLLEWLRRNILELDHQDSEENAESIYKLMIDRIPKPLEYSGLLCYPTFGRPITPTWDTTAAQGSFLGLTIDHHIGHIIQAVLEGNSFSLRANIDAIEKLVGIKIDRLRVEGGITKNPVWMQLKSDITGRVYEAIQRDETTVIGAAVLAGVGAGIYKNHREIGEIVSLESIEWHPEKERQKTYDHVYKDLFQRLPSIFAELYSHL